MIFPLHLCVNACQATLPAKTPSSPTKAAPPPTQPRTAQTLGRPGVTMAATDGLQVHDANVTMMFWVRRSFFFFSIKRFTASQFSAFGIVWGVCMWVGYFYLVYWGAQLGDDVCRCNIWLPYWEQLLRLNLLTSRSLSSQIFSFLQKAAVFFLAICKISCDHLFVLPFHTSSRHQRSPSLPRLPWWWTSSTKSWSSKTKGQSSFHCNSCLQS